MTRSIRDAWRALRRDNFKRKEAERLPAAASFEPGDQVLISYPRGSERTSKHFYRAHGPATVLQRLGDDYIVKINETGTERKVDHYNASERTSQCLAHAGSRRRLAQGAREPREVHDRKCFVVRERKLEHSK